MKNIHVLPTDKPSILYAKDDNYKLANSTMAMDWYISSAGYKPYNIYITNDEEIKEKRLRFIIDNREGMCGLIHQVSVVLDSKICPEIILTTDQDLIKDGVQPIDDEFLEWFVKNPSCEWVEVKEKQHFEADKSKRINPLNGVYYSYKIIIPQEEPKQETLEEAAERYAHNYFNMHETNNYKALKQGYEAGAKEMAERMYSESDKIMKFLNTEKELKLSDAKTIERIKWYFETYFEQFKKK